MKYEFEVAGVTYSANQIGGRKACRLNKQIERVCLNALKSTEKLKEKLADFYSNKINTDGTFDWLDAPIAEIVEVVSVAMESFTDKEWEQFVKDLVEEVKCTIPSLGVLELGDDADFDKAMRGRSGYIYHILFHIMKNNGFGPFVLATFGGLIQKIDS